VIQGWCWAPKATVAAKRGSCPAGQPVSDLESGFANQEATVRTNIQPARLTKAAGVYYREFTSLPAPLALSPDRFGLGAGAEVLARYTGSFLSPYAAITRNRFGKGSLTYEAALPTPEIQRALIAEAASLAGIRGADQSLPTAIRFRSPPPLSCASLTVASHSSTSYPRAISPRAFTSASSSAVVVYRCGVTRVPFTATVSIATV